MSRIGDRIRWQWGWLSLALAAGLWVAAVSYHPTDELHPCDCVSLQGENGLWIHHTWYFGQHTDAETQALARRLCAGQIQYAYFHVRYILQAGVLRFHYREEARRLLKALQMDAPPVRLIAWIYAGNRRGSGRVDLHNPAIRASMVKEAVWLVQQCGFDGIQWDYEVCSNGDPDFLALLRETRAALPPPAQISVDTQPWLPPPHKRWGWSDDYFTQVAALCDQVVVMVYDTAYKDPARYRTLVHQQVVHVTTAVARGNPRCRVLIGLASYTPGDASHHLNVENLRNGIAGVRAGLADPGTNRAVFAGIAPFADYTMSKVDWALYGKLWLAQRPP